MLHFETYLTGVGSRAPVGFGKRPFCLFTTKEFACLLAFGVVSTNRGRVGFSLVLRLVLPSSCLLNFRNWDDMIGDLFPNFVDVSLHFGGDLLVRFLFSLHSDRSRDFDREIFLEDGRDLGSSWEARTIGGFFSLESLVLERDLDLEREFDELLDIDWLLSLASSSIRQVWLSL